MPRPPPKRLLIILPLLLLNDLLLLDGSGPGAAVFGVHVLITRNRMFLSKLCDGVTVCIIHGWTATRWTRRTLHLLCGLCISIFVFRLTIRMTKADCRAISCS